MTTSHEHKPAPRPKGNRIRNFVLLGILAVGLAAGIPALWYRHTHETTDDAEIEGHILPVLPRVGGYVEKVYVIDDQAVQAGDTLFTIDPDELEIKEQQAEADLLAAKAVAKGGVAGAGAHVAEAQKTAAEADLEAARANLDKTKKDADRMRTLIRQDIVSKAQLDAAEAAYRSAQAAYRAAAEQAKGSVFNTLGANAQVKAADARLAAAQAALDAAKLQLSYTVVTAPTTGHIAKKNLEPGQLLAPGQPVMAIVDAAPVWVVANLKETQLQDVKVGQAVEVDVDAYPDAKLHGRVEAIQYATGARFSLLPPDNASGNFTKVVQRVPVRITLDTAEEQRWALRPGLSVSVAIDTRSGS